MRFRSRLEARWAIVFECLGIDWEYEPDGFIIDDTAYLPDFLLHDVTGRNGHFDLMPSWCAPDRATLEDGDVYVEVKGHMGRDSMAKCSAFAHHRPLYVVGSIPFKRDGYSYGDLAATYEGVKYGYAYYSALLVDGADEGLMLATDGSDPMLADQFSEHRIDWRTTSLAYRIAASARFDHGEHPNDQLIADCRARTRR